MGTGVKQLRKDLEPYKWKKGVSANPKGRPKGKTLKEFARDLLMSMTDEEKQKYLKTLPKEIVWKMAEGNPHQTSEEQIKGTVVVEFHSSLKK